MAEIERRFLVGEMPRAEAGETAIDQGYLSLEDQGEVRLRRAGGELLLTAKNGVGEVREEVEVPIEPGAFESLWPLTAGRRVRKVRHYVPLGGGLRAEVDVYEGELEGLRTVEVEFGSRALADRFVAPAWFGAELTGDERYANRTLATAGLPDTASKRDHASVENSIASAIAAAIPSATAEPGTAAGAEPAAPGPSAEPTPSRAYRLLREEDAATGARRVIVARLEKAAGRLRAAGADGDALAEAIHGARKDLKKARAALRLVREELGEKAFRRENRTLRDAARLLSSSRDAEVKLETLDSLSAADGDAPPGPTALWRAALVAERDRIVGGETAAIGDAAAAIEAVAARSPEWHLRRDGWKLLAPGLGTAYSDGREAFAALGAEPAFEAVHELRKRGKDLWYQVRLLRDAWEPVLGATAEEVHDFTDLLGDHHDLAVLAADLDDRKEVDGAHRETLRALIEARQADLLAEARVAGERIYAEKPEAFIRRLRAYWRAWRRDVA